MLTGVAESKCPNCLKKERVRKVIDAKFSVYFCDNCLNAFTYPIPEDVEKYYFDNYWTSKKVLGKLRKHIFSLFQKRRVRWITDNFKQGTFLDVGSGEGLFGRSLPEGFKWVGLEPPGSKVKNMNVIKRDFLKWKTKNRFDAVCFWESLEHTPYPLKYLKKAYQLVNANGKIFIEFPRYNCLESKLFGKNWFHLDLPRHLAHFTEKGITILLKRSGFTNIKLINIASPDYSFYGFTASLLKSLRLDITDNIKKIGNLFPLIVILPVFMLSSVVEIILNLINQSPICLASAQKND